MPTLADLTLAAQQRCDRVNATTITTPEWYSMVNRSAQELYGLLTSTYQDYNIKRYSFSLQGGANQNILLVGPRTQVPDFFQPRGLWYQVNGGPPIRWKTLLRLNAFVERNQRIGPIVSLLYGSVPDCWDLMGNQIEVLPDVSSGGNYLLTYVPTMPQLTQPDHDIDSFWLGVNGWDEYVIIDVARKACIKEESLDTAMLLRQDLQAMRERILREAQPRDDSGPGKIADVKGVRAQDGYEGGGWGGRWGGW